MAAARWLSTSTPRLEQRDARGEQKVGRRERETGRRAAGGPDFPDNIVKSRRKERYDFGVDVQMCDGLKRNEDFFFSAVEQILHA